MSFEKRSVRNWFTYKSKVGVDLGNQKSMTVPGQDVSLRKILEQHSRGMPLPPAVREGEYLGDVDVPDFEEMDPADLMEYTINLREEITQLKERIAQEQKVSQEPDREKQQEENGQ